jgi:hypothetical protein
MWQERRQADPTLTPALLYDEAGNLNAELLNRLVSQRDDRRVSLRE